MNCFSCPGSVWQSLAHLYSSDLSGCLGHLMPVLGTSRVGQCVNFRHLQTARPWQRGQSQITEAGDEWDEWKSRKTLHLVVVLQSLSGSGPNKVISSNRVSSRNVFSSGKLKSVGQYIEPLSHNPPTQHWWCISISHRVRVCGYSLPLSNSTEKNCYTSPGCVSRPLWILKHMSGWSNVISQGTHTSPVGEYWCSELAWLSPS